MKTKGLCTVRYTLKHRHDSELQVLINDPRCQTCKEILVGSQVELVPREKRVTLNIKTKMNCGVREFIYVVTCHTCEENCIGEAGDTLRHRVAVHQNQITQA